MSTETPVTDTTKKSFLTRLAERAAAANAADGTNENTAPETDEVVAKRLLKKAGITLVASLAVMTAVIVVANRLGNEEETDTEVEETENSED